MNTVVSHNRVKDPSGSLRIALAVPEWQPLFQVMNGEPVNATYVIQGNLAKGLRAHGHSLKFIAPRNLREIVCTNDPSIPKLAPRSWSESRWFDLLTNGTWFVQRKLGVPYLNVFSNYRLYDACLQCLPGHDIVYERHGLYRVGVALASKKLKLPYVLFIEADEILEQAYIGTPITGLLRWRASEMMRYNLDTADCIICVSNSLKNHLVNIWNVPEEKIVVFPNAVDVQRFQPDPEARAHVRSSLGYENNPLIIFVGNFYPWHDVTILLESFSKVLTEYPDSRLVLVGDGSERQAMMRLATDLGLDHALKFIGLVPHADIPRWVAAADISVVPYPQMKYDLWFSPLKLFEYMASGTAVVASNIGQVKDVICNGRNGLLVPPGDVSAMTSALKQLIEDTTLRKQLGQNARSEAVQKYSWERYLNRLEKLFAAVISGEPVNHLNLNN